MSDALLVLRKGMGGRGRGALLAWLQHDSKLHMLQLERKGHESAGPEGEHEKGVCAEGGEEGASVEGSSAPGLAGGHAKEATQKQESEEASSFLARVSTQVVEEAMETKDFAELRKQQCVKDIWQGRAQRGEADGMRDGNERVMKQVVKDLMQLMQGKMHTGGNVAQKNGGPGSPAESALDEAALHEWLKALGKEGRLVHAWLKPRLDEAVKKLEGQWLNKVKRCAWGR